MYRWRCKYDCTTFVRLSDSQLRPCRDFGTGADASRSYCHIRQRQFAGFPAGLVVFGRTYAEWAEQWYQWWDLIPVPINPSYDTTGQNCNINQSQPVFFLAGDGTFSASGVTRSCTVPSNTPLFFPMITAECSNVEPAPFFGRTDADRLECARFAIDGVAPVTVVVTVDGHSVPALRDFRIASPPFNFTTPSQNNVLGLPGVTSGRSEAGRVLGDAGPFEARKARSPFRSCDLCGAVRRRHTKRDVQSDGPLISQAYAATGANLRCGA